MLREELELMEKEELLELVISLNEKLESKSKGRKGEVLQILKERGPINIQDIAKELGISNKNVSSQLTYLREEYNICTDGNGKKFIMA